MPVFTLMVGCGGKCYWLGILNTALQLADSVDNVRQCALKPQLDWAGKRWRGRTDRYRHKAAECVGHTTTA